MKKLVILFAVFLFACTASQAQTSKGDQTLGVNLGFSSLSSNQTSPDQNIITGNDVNSGKITEIGIGPSYSYFIANKLDIGASLNYSYYNANNIFNGTLSKQTNYGYSSEIFLRKYFMYTEKFGIRTGAFITYDWQQQKMTYPQNDDIPNSKNTTNDYGAALDLQLVYFPTKHLGFSATLADLSYNHYKTNSGAQGDNSGDNVVFNYMSDGLSASIFYIFGNK